MSGTVLLDLKAWFEKSCGRHVRNTYIYIYTWAG